MNEKRKAIFKKTLKEGVLFMDLSKKFDTLVGKIKCVWF